MELDDPIYESPLKRLKHQLDDQVNIIKDNERRFMNRVHPIWREMKIGDYSLPCQEINMPGYDQNMIIMDYPNRLYKTTWPNSVQWEEMQRMMRDAFKVPSNRLVVGHDNQGRIGIQNYIMKQNFPIGAKVYANDNSYSQNMRTGEHAKIVDHKLEVLSTPFKSFPMVSVGGALPRFEYEFVLVKSIEIDNSDRYMVLNDLRDANAVKVQLNDSYMATVHRSADPTVDGYIKIGCQQISFTKVKEMYEVIFKDRKPEPIAPIKNKRISDLPDFPRPQFGYAGWGGKEILL
jgi:hypothetical protein